jgi:hypothetical protein
MLGIALVRGHLRQIEQLAQHAQGVHGQRQVAIARGINAVRRAQPRLGNTGSAALPMGHCVQVGDRFLALCGEGRAQQVYLYFLATPGVRARVQGRENAAGHHHGRHGVTDRGPGRRGRVCGAPAMRGEAA